MGRHIVGAFGGMPVTSVILRNKPLEKIRQIQHHVRIGIFLNHQRCRCVLDKQCQEPGIGVHGSQPSRHLAGAWIQTLAMRSDFDRVMHLLDGNALGQVARLVDVASAANSNMISE